MNMIGVTVLTILFLAFGLLIGWVASRILPQMTARTFVAIISTISVLVGIGFPISI